MLHAQAAAQACDLSMAATALDFLDCPEDAVEAAADYRDCLSAAAAQGLGLYLHL